MAFTQTELDAIEKAIAEGALEVQYKDKRIKYASFEDLMKRRDLIKRELGLSGKTTRLKAEFSKGLE